MLNFKRDTNPDGSITYEAAGILQTWTIERNLAATSRKQGWVLRSDLGHTSYASTLSSAKTDAAIAEAADVKGVEAQANREHLAELDVVHGARVTLNNDRAVYTVDEVLADGTLRLTSIDGGSLPNVVCAGTLVAAVVSRPALPDPEELVKDARPEIAEPELVVRRGDVVRLRGRDYPHSVRRLARTHIEVCSHAGGMPFDAAVSDVVEILQSRGESEGPEIEAMRAKLSGANVKELGDPTLEPGDVVVFPGDGSEYGHTETVGELGGLLGAAGIELVSVDEDPLVDDGEIVEADAEPLASITGFPGRSPEVDAIRAGDSIVISSGSYLTTFRVVDLQDELPAGPFLIWTRATRGGLSRTFSSAELVGLVDRGRASIVPGVPIVPVRLDEAGALELVREALDLHARETDAQIELDLSTATTRPSLRWVTPRGTVDLTATVLRNR